MEEVGVVSMWLGQTESAAAFRRAMEVAFSDDGELLGSPFSQAFGIDALDDDLREAASFDTPRAGLAEILTGASYEESLLPRFERAGATVDPGTNCVVLVYDYRHAEPRTAALDGVTLVFKGAVAYR